MTKQTRIALLLVISLFARVLVSAQTPATAPAAPKTLPTANTHLGNTREARTCSRNGWGQITLDTGRVLFEENALKLLRPASNMKLYTVATALDKLSPDFRFITSVHAGPDRTRRASFVVH